MSDYDRLERDAEKPPTKVADHSEAWAKLEPVASINGTARERVERFCESKRITLDALAQLGTRYRTDRHGGVELAWGYPIRLNGRETVTAVKFRPLDPSKKRYALTPSVFVRPIVAGNVDALDWFAAEGETDAARLLGLVGDVAAVLVLPAGAKTFKRTWAQWIPRGATVHLAHDADEAGDTGAEKAAKVLGGRTVRVRPPVEGGDWCDFDGSRDEFVELVRAARAGTVDGLEPLDLAAFLAGPPPETDWLWRGWIARGDLVLIVADPKVGKSLLALALAAVARRGGEFLRAHVARCNVAIVDLENPRDELHKRLSALDISADDHDGLHIIHGQALNLAAGIEPLTRLIERYQIGILVIDSLRRAAPGLDENDSRSVAMTLGALKELVQTTGITIIVIHHARKRIGDNPTDAGQMVRGSGDLVASVDELLYLRLKEPGLFTLEHTSRRSLPHEPIQVRIGGDDDRLELINEGAVALAEDKLEAVLSRIIEALHEGPLERKVIALRVDADAKDGTFSRALNLGWQRGQLVKTNEQTRKSNEPLVYALSPEMYQ